MPFPPLAVPFVHVILWEVAASQRALPTLQKALRLSVFMAEQNHSATFSTFF